MDNYGTFTNDGATSSLIANTVLNQAGSTLANDGTATAYTYFANAGTVSGTGALNVSDGYSAGAGASITQDTVHVSGTFANDRTITANVALNVDSGAILGGTGNTVAKGGTNDGTVYQKDITLNGTSYTNNGTMTSTGTFTNSAAVDGIGNLNVNNGSSSGTGASITQANVTVAGDFDNDANMTVYDTLTTYVGADLTNTAAIAATTVDNYGTYTNSGATSSLTANTLTNSGTVNNEGTTTVYGTATNGVGATITNTKDFAATTVDNYGTFTNSGATSTLTANTLTNSGTVTNEGTATVYGTTTNGTNSTITNKKDFATTTLNNYGLFDNENANSSLVADNIQNQAGATLANDGTATSNVLFANEGTVSGTGTLTLNGASNTNAGDITQTTVNMNGDFADTTASSTLTTDNLNIASGKTFTNEGTATVKQNLANGGTITNNKDLILGDAAAPGGAMSGVGTINGTGKTTVYSDLDNDGTIAQKDLTVKENAKLHSDLADLDISSGKIANDGEFEITGGSQLDYDITADPDGSGSGTGRVVLNQPNDMLINSTITDNTLVQNAHTLTFSKPTKNIAGGNLEINGGKIDLQDGKYKPLNMEKLTLNGNSKMSMDSSLTKEKIDQINPNDMVEANNNKIVINPNLPKDTGKTILTNPYITLSPIGDDVKGANRTELANAIEMELPEEIISPIYKYAPYYDSETGNLNVHIPGSTNDYRSYNPSVVVGPIANQIMYLNQLNNYAQAFGTMDALMMTPSDIRTASENRNKFAAEGGGLVTYDPNQIPEESAGVWATPYAAYDKVGLRRGPRVKDFSYGTLVGLDMGMREYSNGWKGLYNVYVGYNGNQGRYDGVHMDYNGGVLGATGIWYKKNLFTGLTANFGMGYLDADTMYGSEDFGMLSAGVASKTGYNWELLNGKFIIQPSLLAAYTFVKSFDYTNAAGVRIKADPLNAITIQPGLKFIGNTKSGWQPYAGISMIFNIMDRTYFKAQDCNLPNMSVKPYIQYGIGVKKSWGDRFTGWAQFMLRNGGRNGFAGMLGLKYSLGRDGNSAKAKSDVITTPTAGKINLSVK